MTDYITELNKCQKDYDLLTKTIETDIELTGKKLEPALSEHTRFQYKWGMLDAKLSGLHDSAKNDTNTAYGKAYVAAQSDNYKSRNSTDAKWMAEQDDDFNKAKRIENKIYRLRKEVDAVCDVIESRKYILKDLTASIINQVNNARID